LLDGAIRCQELVSRVKELNMPAVAITDHGTMAGVLDFYKACNKSGIKPLIGCEIYATQDPDNTPKKTRDNYHLILLAKNNKGYKALLQLISEANKSNFHYKPRVHLEKLKKHAKNLICTSACLASPIHKVFKKEGEDRALEMTKYLHEIFKENFYLEIQENGEEEQEPYNHLLIKFSKQLNIPMIITVDAHYLTKEDKELHELMMAMQFNQTIHTYKTKNTMQYGDQYYIKTPEEIKIIEEKYNITGAMKNTLKIADQCNVQIELGKINMPTFKIKEAEDYEDFLKWKEEKYGC
jgi:DNA polymerase-3 subunit alpha